MRRGQQTYATLACLMTSTRVVLEHFEMWNRNEIGIFDQTPSPGPCARISTDTEPSIF